METLLVILLRNAVGAAILAVAVAAVCLIVRRPALRHTLWVFVLVRLFMPPLWAVDLAGAVGSAQLEGECNAAAVAVPSERPQLSDIDKNPEVASLPDPTAVFSPPDDGIEDPEIPRFEEPVAAEKIREAAVEEVLPPEPARQVEEPFPWKFAVAVAWAASSASIFLLGLCRLRRFQKLLAVAELPEPALLRSADFWSARVGLRQTPRVLLVPGRISPLLFRGTILLPRDLAGQLGAAELDAILLHELAHAARGDHWVRTLEWAASTVYWWLPLVPLVRRQLRAAEEYRCDEMVVEHCPERRAYASALVETASFLAGPLPVVPRLASGAGPVVSLQRRIVMIMQNSPQRPARAARWVCLALGLGSLAFSPAWGRAQPPASTPPAAPAAPPTEPVDPSRVAPPRDAERRVPGAESDALAKRLKRVNEDIATAKKEVAELSEKWNEGDNRVNPEFLAKFNAAKIKLLDLMLLKEGITSESARAPAPPPKRPSEEEVAKLVKDYETLNREVGDSMRKLAELRQKLQEIGVDRPLPRIDGMGTGVPPNGSFGGAAGGGRSAVRPGGVFGMPGGGRGTPGGAPGDGGGVGTMPPDTGRAGSGRITPPLPVAPGAEPREAIPPAPAAMPPQPARIGGPGRQAPTPHDEIESLKKEMAEMKALMKEMREMMRPKPVPFAPPAGSNRD